VYLCMCLKLLISLLSKLHSQVETIKQFALSPAMGSYLPRNQNTAWAEKTRGGRSGPSAAHSLWRVVTGTESSWQTERVRREGLVLTFWVFFKKPSRY